jgi:hypothetical protein
MEAWVQNPILSGCKIINLELHCGIFGEAKNFRDLEEGIRNIDNVEHRSGAQATAAIPVAQDRSALGT